MKKTGAAVLIGLAIAAAGCSAPDRSPTPPPPAQLACRPATCTSLGAGCGVAGDGCGGQLECGGCGPGLACGIWGRANQCAPVPRVTPRTQGTALHGSNAHGPPTLESMVGRDAMIAQELDRDRAELAAREAADSSGLASMDVAATADPGVLARSGSGTTMRRAFAARFTDTINVKDFGAKGDGVSDDTPALQAALNAGSAVGQWIVVPPGEYRVAPAGLRLGGKLRLRGEGAATIIGSGTDGQVLHSGSGGNLDPALEDFVIKDLKITTSNVDLSPGMYLDYSLLNITNGVNGGLVENVTFDVASSKQGCMLVAPIAVTHYVKNVSVVNNRCITPLAGFTVYNGVGDDTLRIERVNISNNFLKNNGLYPSDTSPFISSMGMSLAGQIKGVTITGNQIYDFVYTGIEIAWSAAPRVSSDVTISNNRIENTGWGIIFDSHGNNGTRSERAVISGNSIRNNKYGMRFQFLDHATVTGNTYNLYDASTSADRISGVQIEYSDNTVFSGNNFDLDLPWAENARARVAISGVTKSVFSGNRFRTTGNYGLLFHGGAGASNNNAFLGNSFVQEPSSGNAAEGAAVVQSGASNVFIGNHVYTNNPGLTIVQSGGANTVVRGTVIYDVKSGIRSDSTVLELAVSGAALDASAHLGWTALRIVGSTATSPFALVMPQIDGLYGVTNGSNQPADVKTISGTGVLVPAGSTARIRVQDGQVQPFGAAQEAPHGVSGDLGDSDATVSPRQMQPIMRFATPITGTKTVTLLKGGGRAGDWWRIVRSAAGTGQLDVVNEGGAGIASILANKNGAIEVAWDAVGNQWVLTNFSTW